MQRDELKAQAKVVDMMLTMHSILSRRFYRRAQFQEIALIVISTVLLSLTFADQQALSYFSLTPETSRILTGVCSIIVFVLSVIALIVDWKGKAIQHREAFNSLVPLKAEWREMLSNYDEHDDRTRADFKAKSALILGHLIPIPDTQFNRLKAKHHRKVMLSKFISAHPGSSVYVLWVCLWVRSNRKVLKDKFPDRTSQ